MELSDALVFLGTVAVLLLTIGLGAVLAMGIIPTVWLLVIGGALISLILLGLLAFGVGFLVKKFRERKVQPEVIAEPEPIKEPEPVSEPGPEPEPEPEPDYRDIMMKNLSERCERVEEKFLLCRMAFDNIKKLKKEYEPRIIAALLTEAEKRILKCLKDTDKVYRADRDEYVAVLEEENSDDWKKRLGDIDQIMREAFEIENDGQPVTIETTVSIGFAIFPGMGDTPNGLYELAGLQLEMSTDSMMEEAEDELILKPAESDSSESQPEMSPEELALEEEARKIAESFEAEMAEMAAATEKTTESKE